MGLVAKEKGEVSTEIPVPLETFWGRGVNWAWG